MESVLITFCVILIAAFVINVGYEIYVDNKKHNEFISKLKPGVKMRLQYYANNKVDQEFFATVNKIENNKVYFTYKDGSKEVDYLKGIVNIYDHGWKIYEW